MGRKKGDKHFTWLIAYIDKDHIDLLDRDLKKSIEYKEVEAFIPMVKILKKTFKGKSHFEEIPLLFNYGFFKVPRKYAVSMRYLENMQKNINCIFSWLKDPLKPAKSREVIRKKKEKGKIGDLDIPIATATAEEVADLLSKSFNYSIHSPEDLSQLIEGSVITLKGYPFEGINAELLKADMKKKKAKVRLLIFDSKREVEVSFENVLFTIYHGKGYDDSLSSTKSLEELQNEKKLDKQLFKNQRNENK